jgi:hypothetical protein
VAPRFAHGNSLKYHPDSLDRDNAERRGTRLKTGRSKEVLQLQLEYGTGGEKVDLGIQL